MDKPDGLTAKRRTPRKRVVTEKRRLQNKCAQEAYRQRQKQHLAFLEDLVVSQRLDKNSDCGSPARVSDDGGSTSVPHKAMPFREPTQEPETGTRERQVQEHTDSTLAREIIGSEPVTAFAVSNTQDSVQTHLPKLFTSDSGNLATQSSQAINQPDLRDSICRLPISHTLWSPDDNFASVPLPGDNEVSYSLWANDGHLVLPETESDATDQRRFESLAVYYSTRESWIGETFTAAEGCLPSAMPDHTPLGEFIARPRLHENDLEGGNSNDRGALNEAMHGQISDLDRALRLDFYHDTPISDQGASTSTPVPEQHQQQQQQMGYRLPDVHANNIRVLEADTACAYVTNASILGILNPKDLFDPFCPSPFYSAAPQPLHYYHNFSISKTTTASFPAHYHPFTSAPPPLQPQSLLQHQHQHQPLPLPLPPNLRPTPPQHLYPHHPWLDLLPFPAFRARALAGGPRRLYDPHELKFDALYRGGLICWRGKGVGGRSGGGGGGGGGVGTGQPWDARSWEAAAWFVSKWWMLTGGEEGELGAQSRWWRGLRGE